MHVTRDDAKPTNRGRYALPGVVSVALVIVGTVYPLWAVVVLTVPLGAFVAVAISDGVWRGVCVRLGIAIPLLGIGGLAASAITDGYGSVAAALPCVLASLLFAVCSALPAAEASWRRPLSVLACACAGVASLLALVDGLHSLFYPLYASDRAGDALSFAVLLIGAPGLILLVRLAVPWTGRAAANADTAAAAALGAGLVAAFLFGHISPSPSFSLALEIVANSGALVLLVWATVLGARAATAQ